MMTRPSLFVVALMTVAAALVALSAPDSAVCGVQAADAPSDWCFSLPVDVTNNTGGDLEDYAVRFTLNCDDLIGSSRMSPLGWDARMSTSAYSDQIPLFLQDLDETSCAWWFLAPSIATGETRTFKLWLGAEDHQRDQGFPLNGANRMDATGSINPEGDGGFDVEVVLSLHDSEPQNGRIVGHHDGSVGWALDLVGNAGSLELNALADGTTISAAWDDSWNDQRSQFILVYDGSNFVLNGPEGVAIAGTSGANVTATSTDFQVGNGVTGGAIHDIFWQPTGHDESRWGFDPVTGFAAGDKITETSAANPTYESTTPNYRNISGGDGTITIESDQSQLDVEVGALSVSTVPVVPDFARDAADVVGEGVETDLYATDENQFFPLYDIFADGVEGSSIPRQMWWALIFVPLGLFAGAIVLKGSSSMPLALTAAGLPIGFAVVNGLIEPWYLVIWVFAVAVTWGAGRWGDVR